MDTSNLIMMNAALSSLATEAIIGLLNLRLSSKFLFNKDCRVKKWCKACKKSEKEEKKAQFREQERLREEMYAEAQKKLFEQAKQSYHQPPHDDGYCFEVPEPEALVVGEKLMELLQQGEENDERTYTQEQMNAAVEFVL